MSRRTLCIGIAGVIALASVSFTGHATVPSTAPVAAPADETFDLSPTIELVPVNYRHRLVQQLSLAEDNEQTWLKAIVDSKPEHREAIAYLLTNMPESDLKNMKGDRLVNNVALAYATREQTPWGKAIPQEIFFSDVLPYSNVDEIRDDWRKDYHDRFMPLVQNAKSATEAVQILNRKIFKVVNVKYHATKRDKPNQSPYESMKNGYASCTGLSIILSDACRSVGIPARLVGTPLWSDNSGNHTWTEVWDKQWYFTGSAEPAKQLNQGWFAANAAKADESKPEHRIYAASFIHTPIAFPMVWNEQQTDVSAVDVTNYYTHRQTVVVTTPSPETKIELRQNGTLIAAATGPADFQLGAGEYDQTLIDASGKIVETRKLKVNAAAPPSTAPAVN